jgi:glycyl-tRNA synthetase
LWKEHALYLRPETAQAIFVQFNNVVQTMGAKVPFGIAQIGKSFRNEIIVEHFIFRSCEFEQMELEFFCKPGTEQEWFSYWTEERLDWYRTYARHGDHFRLREHAVSELAHYAAQCVDLEYAYPWGWGELEGIASRKDFDLTQHSKASRTKLSYWDHECGRYTPYVIEPSAGLTRAFLCFLLDAYDEEEGESGTRTVLRLHPKLAPIQLAILPLVKKDGMPEWAQKLAEEARKHWVVDYDEQQSIGKRYARHDEIGTPFCITVDQQSVQEGQVTLRLRDDRRQIRLTPEGCWDWIRKALL